MTKTKHDDQVHVKMREYSRHWRRFQRFKLAPDRLYAALDLQGGRCAVCEAPYNDAQIWVPVRNAGGIVLGVVCPTCAKMLWAANYETWLLDKAAEFLTSDPPLDYPYVKYGPLELQILDLMGKE